MFVYIYILVFPRIGGAGATQNPAFKLGAQVGEICREGGKFHLHVCLASLPPHLEVVCYCPLLSVTEM